MRQLKRKVRDDEIQKEKYNEQLADLKKRVLELEQLVEKKESEMQLLRDEHLITLKEKDDKIANLCHHNRLDRKAVNDVRYYLIVLNCCSYL